MPHQTRDQNNGGGKGQGPNYNEATGLNDIRRYRRFFKQDQGWLNAKSSLERAQTGYATDSARATRWTNKDFGTSMDNMRDQAVRDRVSMADDQASRGIFTSGIAAKQVGDYNTDLAKQQAAQRLAHQRSLTGISSNLSDQNQIINEQRKAAHQDAILRYMQQYGLRGAPGLLGG